MKNAMDDEFEHFWERVSCFVANEFPYEDKCDFVTRAVDCNRSTNVIPYMLLMACKLKCINPFQEHCVLTLFVTICMMMVALLLHVVYSYYGPALKTVSKLIHMNEHLAGVTILAFGNSSADLFANLANIRTQVPVYSASISSALLVSMVSGGIVCYINPFRMNGFETARDILFLIFGMSVVQFYMLRPTKVTAMELFGLFSVYIIYIIVNIVDLYLMRRDIRIIKAQIEELESLEYTEENYQKLRALETTLDGFQDQKLEIFEKRYSGESNGTWHFATKRMRRYTRVSVNTQRNKDILYDRNRGKNWNLFKEFWRALRPIKCSEWQKANMIDRTLLLAKTPIVLLCVLYIPLVDYEMKKHGWKKLLNTIHVVINPAITITVFSSIVLTPHAKLWYIEIRHIYIHGVYSTAITLPLAVFIFFNSRTDRPPRYHWVFSILNLSSCMLVIYVSATEIDRVMEVITRNLQLDKEFMSASVKAWTTNLGPLVANTAMAMHGYPRMAYASAIGGSMFSLVLAPSIVLLARRLLNKVDEKPSGFGDYGHNAFFFLLFGLLCTLLWTTTLGFFARRSMGIFSIALYVIHLIYIKLIHLNIIHSFSYDHPLSAAFGDL